MAAGRAPPSGCGDRGKQGNSVIYSMASPEMAELPAVARTILAGLLTDQVGLLKDLRTSARTAARATR